MLKFHVYDVLCILHLYVHQRHSRVQIYKVVASLAHHYSICYSCWVLATFYSLLQHDTCVQTDRPYIEANQQAVIQDMTIEEDITQEGKP